MFPSNRRDIALLCLFNMVMCFVAVARYGSIAANKIAALIYSKSTLSLIFNYLQLIIIK